MNRDFEQDIEALAKTLEAIPEHVVVLDREGRILYVNHVEEGYERDTVIGTLAHEIILPDSRELLEQVLTAVFESGGAPEREYETRIHAPDGSEQWYRSRVYPIQDGDRVVAGMLMVTNVTEMKGAQEELQRARETSDQLRRLLPICSWCDRIRNVEGNWETIESYLGREAETDVSHSLCPVCYEREMAAVGTADDTGPADEGEAGPTPA
ncbi:MAG TPA: PAS domain S-box protein [Gemmatimonadota bacterium]|nr:PAS domain S-box protein [Gemmatimonadota bacterium]